MAAFAICAALYRRTQSGSGERIDVSMLDSALTSMAVWPIANYLNAGVDPRPVGNDNPTASPSGTFKTGDGLINIVNNEQKQFEALCQVLSAPDILQDARFSRSDKRVENRAALSAILEDRLKGKSAAEWERILSEAGVPAGRIYTVPEILEHPQVAQRDILKWFDATDCVQRRFAVTRTGFRLASGQPDVESAPPLLGEHTLQILHELGYSDSEIEDLRAQGTI
jgi:CoA:oxalate CoA-transferase